MELKEWLKSEIGRDIWEKKYRHIGESLDSFFDRVSGGNEHIRRLLIEKKFLPAGRTLANRGVEGKKTTYSNCYYIKGPEDNIPDIYRCAAEVAQTFSTGGGVGICLSHLSPKGAKINNAAKTTSGAVSFMDLYGLTSELIAQNGRRGALMITLECSHPDILDFIKVKRNNDKVTKANISIKVTDVFMQAVRRGELWEMSFTRPETGEEIKTTAPAEYIFDAIAESMHDWAEPGILFWDEVQRWNMASHNSNYELVGVNPCIVGNTKVQTVEGEIEIKDLVGKEIDVYCMDDNGQLTIRKAKNIRKTRENAQLVTIWTTRGILTCTPDHKIFTRNRGYVEAKNLTTQDKIVGLNRRMKNERYCGVSLTGNSKYINEQRFIMSHYHSLDGMDVHHLDGDTLNNKKSNLEVLKHGGHSVLSNIGHKDWNERNEKGQFLPKLHKRKKEQLTTNGLVGVNLRIHKIIFEDYTEDVYDLEVEEFHNFIANRIVIHNCGEQPLTEYGSCNLSSFNLSEYVTDPFTNHAKFNMDELVADVAAVVGYMNEILDENLEKHPLPQQREITAKFRPVGIGVMGFADMLLKLGIPYNYKASKMINYLGDRMLNAAVNASIDLAREYGPYPAFTMEGFDIKTMNFITTNLTDRQIQDLYDVGIRNVGLLSIAPTGSLSTMLGVSGGIEPIYDTHYMRKTESLHGEDRWYKVYTPIVKEYIEVVGEEPKGLLTAKNIKYEDRILVQSHWQLYVDSAISSTINLPQSATIADIKDIIIMAHLKGLKGITVYRDGCKRSGILESEKEKCPECGGEIVNENGCKHCAACGWGLCSL